jgi:hypothetical protein
MELRQITIEALALDRVERERAAAVAAGVHVVVDETLPHTFGDGEELSDEEGQDIGS